MAAGLRIGLSSRIYRNTGNYAVPTWTNLAIVQNAKMTFDINMASFGSRGGQYEENLPALTKGPIEFSMLSDTSDTSYDAIRDAAIAKTVLDIAFADDAIATTGTRYWRADYYVSKFAPDQTLEQVNTTDVALSIARSTNARSFTTV